MQRYSYSICKLNMYIFSSLIFFPSLFLAWFLASEVAICLLVTSATENTFFFLLIWWTIVSGGILSHYGCEDLTAVLRFNFGSLGRDAAHHKIWHSVRDSIWFNLKWCISALPKYNSSENIKSTNAWGKTGSVMGRLERLQTQTCLQVFH